MNNDLISREALKKEVENLVVGGAEGLKNYYENGSKADENSWIGGVYDAWELINDAPTVEEKSYAMGYQDGLEDGLQDIRPHGKWINLDCSYASECSICKHREIFPTYNFCPNCGADMRGGRS